MASTRNINFPGNYCLEQKRHTDSAGYTLYANSQYGAAYKTQLPGLGVCPGQIPGDQLSQNSTAVESFLFGIGSSNLVNPGAYGMPAQSIKIASQDFFANRTAVNIPRPLVVEKSQRPALFYL